MIVFNPTCQAARARACLCSTSQCSCHGPPAPRTPTAIGTAGSRQCVTTTKNDASCHRPDDAQVMDAALLMTALTKPDPRDFMALPYREIDWPGKLGGDVKGKRLGLVLDISVGLTPQPAVRTAIEAAAKAFERAGGASTPNDIIHRVSRIRIAILLRLQHSALQMWYDANVSRMASAPQGSSVPSDSPFSTHIGGKQLDAHRFSCS
jgi:Asp-tRNA(Asn)/Glu-tRNA(Gln) amidotransferase A subunit family amidase